LATVDREPKPIRAWIYRELGECACPRVARRLRLVYSTASLMDDMLTCVPIRTRISGFVPASAGMVKLIWYKPEYPGVTPA